MIRSLLLISLASELFAQNLFAQEMPMVSPSSDQVLQAGTEPNCAITGTGRGLCPRPDKVPCVEWVKDGDPTWKWTLTGTLDSSNGTDNQTVLVDLTNPGYGTVSVQQSQQWMDKNDPSNTTITMSDTSTPINIDIVDLQFTYDDSTDPNAATVGYSETFDYHTKVTITNLAPGQTKDISINVSDNNGMIGINQSDLTLPQGTETVDFGITGLQPSNQLHDSVLVVSTSNGGSDPALVRALGTPAASAPSGTPLGASAPGTAEFQNGQINGKSTGESYNLVSHFAMDQNGKETTKIVADFYPVSQKGSFDAIDFTASANLIPSNQDPTVPEYSNFKVAMCQNLIKGSRIELIYKSKPNPDYDNTLTKEVTINQDYLDSNSGASPLFPIASGSHTLLQPALGELRCDKNGYLANASSYDAPNYTNLSPEIVEDAPVIVRQNIKTKYGATVTTQFFLQEASYSEDFAIWCVIATVKPRTVRQVMCVADWHLHVHALLDIPTTDQTATSTSKQVSLPPGALPLTTGDLADHEYKLENNFAP